MPARLMIVLNFLMKSLRVSVGCSVSIQDQNFQFRAAIAPEFSFHEYTFTCVDTVCYYSAVSNKRGSTSIYLLRI